MTQHDPFLNRTRQCCLGQPWVPVTIIMWTGMRAVEREGRLGGDLCVRGAQQNPVEKPNCSLALLTRWVGKTVALCT